MPFDVTKNKNGFTVKSKVSGRVAHPKTVEGMKGYIWHAEHSDTGKGVHTHERKEKKG